MSDGTAYKDAVGRSFSHVEIAIAHASVIARELAVEAETMLAFRAASPMTMGMKWHECQ
jgi:hypothetical protein